MLRRSILAVLLVVSGNIPYAYSESIRNESRGELLYATHCIACHDKEVHWRDKALVTDFASLKSEVRRWQSVVGLGWGEDDVAEVARYLNSLHYYRYSNE